MRHSDFDVSVMSELEARMELHNPNEIFSLNEFRMRCFYKFKVSRIYLLNSFHYAILEFDYNAIRGMLANLTTTIANAFYGNEVASRIIHATMQYKLVMECLENSHTLLISGMILNV